MEDGAMRLKLAKFGIKRKVLRSCNSTECFKTQQICVREETSEIHALLALPKCADCLQIVWRVARAMLSSTAPVRERPKLVQLSSQIVGRAARAGSLLVWQSARSSTIC